MNRGIYTAAGGMITETYRTDTIANNLANSNTAGYKKDINVSFDFYKMLIERINDGQNPPPQIGILGTGSVSWENYVVHQGGSIKDTGDPLNLAISGKGYFTVETPAGIRYTRNGAFTLSDDGTLVTQDGDPVMGVGGARITAVDNQPIHISDNGTVYNGEQQIGQLELIDVADTRAMTKEAGVFFRLDNNSMQRPFTGKISSRVLEMSNVNIIEEMVNLIGSYRAYEINAKAVQTHDQLNDKAVNDVGKM